jgi:hypothetical protein
MLDRRQLGAAVAVIAVATVGGLALLSNPGVQGELKAWTGSAPDSPTTVYGYLPISADSGFFDFGPLTLAGEAPSPDATAAQYRCHDNGYYIDQDGDRGVQYYSGDHISGDAGYYFYGYDKSYAYAEVCGGRYNYQCEMGSGCEGYTEEEPDDAGDDGGDESGDDTGDDSGDRDDSGDSGGTDTNKPPEIESIDTPSTVNVSEPFTVSVQASDPDSPALTYSWSNGKEGQSIILNYGEPGVKELDVEVSDGAGNMATSTVRVNVVEQEDESEEPVEDPTPANPLVQFWNWFTGLFG